MPPSSFQFSATLPCDASYRDPLRELVRCALQYVGYPEPELAAMLAEIDAAAIASLPAARNGSVAKLWLTSDGDTLAIEIGGPHVPSEPPSVGTMTVMASQRNGQPVLKFVQRLPVA